MKIPLRIIEFLATAAVLIGVSIPLLLAGAALVFATPWGCNREHREKMVNEWELPPDVQMEQRLRMTLERQWEAWDKDQAQREGRKP